MRDEAKVKNNEARKQEFGERMGNKRKVAEEAREDTGKRGKVEVNGEGEKAAEVDCRRSGRSGLLCP